MDTYQDKPHIALLPGLEGTGEFFSPIIPYLEKHFKIHVVRYTDEVTFNDYVNSALDQIPKDTPISLVAESFSGLIAIALLESKNPNYRASVLSAAFCKSPLPFFTKLSKYLPKWFFSSNAVSKALIDLLATGADATPDIRDKARELFDKGSSSQFQNRVNIINKVNLCRKLKKIKAPLLYIQATEDDIVLSDSGAKIKKRAKNIKMVRVKGSHLILQTQPEKCAELIISHITSNSQT